MLEGSTLEARIEELERRLAEAAARPTGLRAAA
jgi:hypothetical protein